MQKSNVEKEAESRKAREEEDRIAAEEEEARNSGRPQLLNLNEDGMLDRKIFLDLSKHTDAKVGRKQPDQANNP